MCFFVNDSRNFVKKNVQARKCWKVVMIVNDCMQAPYWNRNYEPFKTYSLGKLKIEFKTNANTIEEGFHSFRYKDDAIKLVGRLNREYKDPHIVVSAEIPEKASYYFNDEHYVSDQFRITEDGVARFYAGGDLC